jgi:hypothetical protein
MIPPRDQPRSSFGPTNSSVPISSAMPLEHLPLKVVHSFEKMQISGARAVPRKAQVTPGA